MEAPSTTEVTATPPSRQASTGKLANLIRHPKGFQPAALAAHRADPEQVRITRKTLLAEINQTLHAKDGLLLKKLAKSIVDNAIDGNSACIQFLADRLSPVDSGSQQRTILEGITLQLSKGDDGSSSITLTRATHESGRAPTVALPDESESHWEGHTISGDTSGTPVDGTPNCPVAPYTIESQAIGIQGDTSTVDISQPSD